MKRAVVIICDGLRSDMVKPNLTPHLCYLQTLGRSYKKHRSVFPSTTRTTAASIATGCYPGRHGLHGNSMALNEGKGLQPLSVGPKDFRDRLRSATGRTLKVPTLSEYLKDKEGAIIFSNVSPGAAYFQDPDGFGHVYHREGSFAPGLVPIFGDDHLAVSHDQNGDRDMCERFCEDILLNRKPSYSVLWQCEPDHTQHSTPLGSPENLRAIASADQNVGRVLEVLNSEELEGDEILLIVGSDHGHETVSKLLPLTELLIEAGLKESEISSDVVVAPNGFSANLYLSDRGWSRLERIVNFLEQLDEIDHVFYGDDLVKLGHSKGENLGACVVAKSTNKTNQFGVPGLSVGIEVPGTIDSRLGCGQHGGLGQYEQNPFLIIKGSDFKPGTTSDLETSAVDIAPTVLDFFGISQKSLDGNSLSAK